MSGRTLNVHAPGAVASVRGTVLDVATDGQASRFDLFQGEIRVADTFGNRTVVSPGQRSTVSTKAGITGTSSLPPTRCSG